ncbi:unnamed protein product [Rhizoctonia solani]|uniref:Peptidase C14 caspase domain-containing protein n=1 Tax=Rhizoctonia solani TaxID=456999 RepID=A0A8H3CPJ0_9AGAM|nr:unnamed protein product [Rhizoctonia solani]
MAFAPNRSSASAPSLPLFTPGSTYADYLRDLTTDFTDKFRAQTWRNVDDLRPTSNKRRALVGVIRSSDKFEYQPEDICVLADIEVQGQDAAGVADDTSRQPDRANIVKAITWLAADSGDGQNRFLYFAGHGHIQHYATGDEPRSREGIFPCDVKFEPLQKCAEPCHCENNNWEIVYDSDHNELERRMPRLRAVLWDYNLNLLLTSTMLPGTKFTALFDCCHSGGTLERLPIERELVSRTTRLARELDIPGSWQTQVDPGSAPKERVYQETIAARGPGTRRGSQTGYYDASSVKTTCTDLRNAVRLPMPGFRDACHIMCWAACRREELAWESQTTTGPYGAGRFTEVFTEYVAPLTPVNPGNLFETRSFEGLIEKIKSTFEYYNSSLTAQESWREQHPKSNKGAGI